jgi:hypothetical protein
LALHFGYGACDLIRVAGADRHTCTFAGKRAGNRASMPRVPPSTTAFLPFKPKSICVISFVDPRHLESGQYQNRKLRKVTCPLLLKQRLCSP